MQNNINDIHDIWAGLQCLKKMTSIWTPGPSWNSYQFGIQIAEEELLDNIGPSCSPKQLYRCIIMLQNLSIHWRERAINQVKNGTPFKDLECWFVVQGIEEVKSFLSDALEDFLEQLVEE